VGKTLLSLGNGHLAEARNSFQEAIETDRQNGQRWELATDHASYAEWFERQGDLAQAREHLNKAIEIFQACGADGWVTRTEEKLARLWPWVDDVACQNLTPVAKLLSSSRIPRQQP
jgi:tetratricopeptide (TPR) repeat protein